MGTLKNLSTDVTFVKKDLNEDNSLSVIVRLTIRIVTILIVLYQIVVYELLCLLEMTQVVSFAAECTDITVRNN